MSAVTHFGADAFLDKVIDAFNGLKMEEVYNIHEDGKLLGDQDPTRDRPNVFEDITETEKPILIEAQYLDPLVLKHTNIWSVKHPNICKMVWMLPW
jgi:hypothetical protein